jgi:hypothetical protein
MTDCQRPAAAAVIFGRSPWRAAARTYPNTSLWRPRAAVVVLARPATRSGDRRGGAGRL